MEMKKRELGSKSLRRLGRRARTLGRNYLVDRQPVANPSDDKLSGG